MARSSLWQYEARCRNRWKTHCFHSELTSEIPTDHVRDDAVRPHSLGSGGGGSPPATERLSVRCSRPPDTLVGRGAINCDKCVEIADLSIWTHRESAIHQCLLCYLSLCGCQGAAQRRRCGRFWTCGGRLHLGRCLPRRQLGKADEHNDQ